MIHEQFISLLHSSYNFTLKPLFAHNSEGAMPDPNPLGRQAAALAYVAR